MTPGYVTPQREAIVTVRVIGPTLTADIDVVVDTGFTGFLTLPTAVVASLGLTQIGRSQAILADGSEWVGDSYTAEIEWFGEVRTVSVRALESDALLGMRLLLGHELRVEVTPGGAVEVRPFV